MDKVIAKLDRWCSCMVDGTCSALIGNDIIMDTAVRILINELEEPLWCSSL